MLNRVFLFRNAGLIRVLVKIRGLYGIIVRGSQVMVFRALALPFLG